MTVRPALATDIPWLVEQLREFDTFFGAGRSLFPGEARACEILAALIADHVFLVAEDSTGPVGFIAGHIGTHPFAGFPVLTELFWWVVPAYRGTGAGLALLNRYVEIGRRLCPRGWVLMTLEHDSPVSDRILLKRGFHLKERSYLLEVA